MQPTRALWEAMQDLLAADVATLAAALAMKVHLAKANFIPTLDLVLASLVEATFTGSAAKAAGTGTQPTYYDVASGFRVIEILEPAGGWHWACTVTPSPAETIYGWYVTDNAGTTLWGAGLLPSPITIDGAGQGLDIPFIQLRFRADSPF